MIVQELLELLEDYDPEAEVRLAHQPTWPLQFHVRGVAANFELPNDEVDDLANDGEVVWIVEGGHPSDSPYAPNSIWDIARR